MAQKVGDAYVQLDVKDKGYSRKMGIAEKKLGKVGKAAIALGAIFSVTLAARIAAASFNLAVAADEIDSKFSVVFKNVSNNANAMASNLERSYGLSVASSKELLSNTGDLLSGFGFTQTAALELSGKVQRLAVDLASFTNIEGGAKRASASLTKALLGERESVKELGIAILESDVTKEVAIMRSEGMTFASNRQAKAEATLRIAIRQSKNAIGDYARTQDSTANKIKLMKERLGDLGVAFGKLFTGKGVQNGLEIILSSVKGLTTGFHWLGEKLRWAFEPIDRAVEKLKDLEELKAFKKTVESDGGRGTFNALFGDSAKDGGAAGGGGPAANVMKAKAILDDDKERQSKQDKLQKQWIASSKRYEKNRLRLRKKVARDREMAILAEKETKKRRALDDAEYEESNKISRRNDLEDKLFAVSKQIENKGKSSASFGGFADAIKKQQMASAKTPTIKLQERANKLLEEVIKAQQDVVTAMEAVDLLKITT